MIIQCADPWFSYIRDGQKQIEGRKNKSPWTKLAVGSIVTFVNNDNVDQKFKARITKINIYSSQQEDDEQNNALRRYLLDNGVSNVLPEISDLEEGYRIYRQWSTLDEILTYGFLAIHLVLI